MHSRYVGTHVWEHNNPCAQPDFNGTSLKSTRGLPMLNDATCFKQIFIVCGFTDLRSGIDTLASIVSEKTELGPFLPDTLILFCGIKSDHIKGLVYLLRNSLVSPSLLAGIWNAKYVNAAPLYQQEQEFQRMGLAIDRTDMARWTIQCAERYLAIIYDYLHKEMYKYHVLLADETPMRVTKENRTEGAKNYMWVYRTGRMYADKQIVLYEYQPTRNACHPREFLKNFAGVCVMDGYQVYHTIEKEREDLKIAGC